MRLLALACLVWLASAPLALARTALVASQAEGACAAWPGEPRPLPDVHADDPFAARWAALRRDELAQAARALEPESPDLARKAWQHVACLDPGSTAARAALARLERAGDEAPTAAEPAPPGAPEPAVERTPAAQRAPPAAARAPTVARAPPVERAPAPPPAPAAARAPARRTSGASAAPAAGDTETGALDARIAEVEALLFAARFRDALARASALGPALDTGARRARIAVLAATAQLALRRTRAAHESLARALEADPELRLAPDTTSPRVRRALESVRARARQMDG